MIQQGFLLIQESGVYLLGYPLPLSPTERRILTAVCNLPYPTSQLLLQAMDTPMSRSCLAVHISSINKKARAIGGRHLLEVKHGVYRLNPTM